MWDDINTGVFVIRPDRWRLSISTQYLHCIYTISTVYLHSIYCILHSIYCIYTVSTQYLHSIYTVFTQYLHCIYTVSTLHIHSIYSISTHYIRREELLYLLNLKVLGRVRVRQPVAGDQGWINEVYLWEKFNIGLEYNLRTGVVQVITN